MAGETAYQLTGKGRRWMREARKLVRAGLSVDDAALSVLRSNVPDFDPNTHSDALQVFAAAVELSLRSSPGSSAA